MPKRTSSSSNLCCSHVPSMPCDSCIKAVHFDLRPRMHGVTSAAVTLAANCAMQRAQGQGLMHAVLTISKCIPYTASCRRCTSEWAWGCRSCQAPLHPATMVHLPACATLQHALDAPVPITQKRYGLFSTIAGTYGESKCSIVHVVRAITVKYNGCNQP